MEKPIDREKFPAEGTPEKEFHFWNTRMNEQLDYLLDVVKRRKAGQLDLERFTEVSESALERLRYIQQQRVWILGELLEKWEANGDRAEG